LAVLDVFSTIVAFVQNDFLLRLQFEDVHIKSGQTTLWSGAEQICKNWAV